MKGSRIKTLVQLYQHKILLLLHLGQGLPCDLQIDVLARLSGRNCWYQRSFQINRVDVTRPIDISKIRLLDSTQIPYILRAKMI
jgi:hypothetical protein